MTISNDTDSSETLSNVGFFISPTQIPLDDLNFNGTPPTGMSGSPFMPVPSLDGKSLGAGQSTNFSTPEPSGLISMGTGLLIVVGCLRRAASRRRG